MTNKGVEDASVQMLDYETAQIGKNSRTLKKRHKDIRRVNADRQVYQLVISCCHCYGVTTDEGSPTYHDIYQCT